MFFFHDAPRAGLVWTPGARLAGFIKRTSIHCYTQNMKALGLAVLDTRFLKQWTKCIFLSHYNLISSGPDKIPVAK